LGYLYFERVVYKNDGYKGKKLVWADKTVLCTTSHMLEWQWKHGKYSILDPETIRCSSLHISALG
jgi:hypothetical protein